MKKSYVEVRNSFISQAEARANKLVKQSRFAAIAEYNAAWNRTFLKIMNTLVYEYYHPTPYEWTTA